MNEQIFMVVYAIGAVLAMFAYVAVVNWTKEEASWGHVLYVGLLWPIFGVIFVMSLIFNSKV